MALGSQELGHASIGSNFGFYVREVILALLGFLNIRKVAEDVMFVLSMVILQGTILGIHWFYLVRFSTLALS